MSQRVFFFFFLRENVRIYIMGQEKSLNLGPFIRFNRCIPVIKTIILNPLKLYIDMTCVKMLTATYILKQRE